MEESILQRDNQEGLLKDLHAMRADYERLEAERAAQLVTRIEGVAGALTKQDAQLGRMTKLVVAKSHLEVYDTGHEFFDGLGRALSQSHSRVWVTYVRAGPPRQQIEEGQDYFEACERWAKKQGHSFRRIIYCHPDNSDLRDWVAGEHLKTLDVARHFAVRVWPDRAIDRMSIALFDDREVVCSFVADRDDIQAFSIENAAVVQHFRGFFQRLWDMSELSQEFLIRLAESNQVCKLETSPESAAPMEPS
jgi:hypothetical protein